ncbi:RAMP superfamily CRISPR-associated protein [Actinopolyspora halophila]|uniref:RAMP superfamily CRISPR-associated protein n=1 Tax=Actinopolyspora halophila TaxID=1850 RepID=UPI00035D3091|nr:RAMP superfamily CRISPR-associated protein [Actinopolyspora halophila]
MKSALFRIRLRMRSPGGVTAPEASADPGQALRLRRDTSGRVHLPGSTVAGSLRAHCEHYEALAPTETRPGLFGQPPSGEKPEQRRASPVGVLGTLLRSAEQPVTSAPRTSIDRQRGAASNKTLHRAEQLPAGTEFDIVLRWDRPDERFDEFLRALRTWRPGLGRGTSHGAGLSEVVGLGHRVYDLATSRDLLDWLRTATPEDYPEAAPCEPHAPRNRLLDVELAIVDGIHIGIGGTDEEPDANPESTEGVEDVPKVSRVLRRDGQFLIPGTSLKGVLRSRVEYICRVVGAPACPEQSCGSCYPCEIFGYGGRSGHSRRSRVAVHDATITAPTLEERRHVAIDRFTGGAAPELLYTDEVLTGGRFRLHVEALEPLDELEQLHTLLLNTALADLHDGLVGIGARTTAGCGTVHVTDPDWQRPREMATLADRLRKESA